MSEDAGIKPRTVATLALAVRHSYHSARSHPHSARSNPQSHIKVVIMFWLRFQNYSSIINHTRNTVSEVNSIFSVFQGKLSFFKEALSKDFGPKVFFMNQPTVQ